VTVRALVVGLGSIGQRHARNLRSILGDELVLCALRSGHARAVVSDRLEADSGDPAADCDGGVFTDLDDALATAPDLVVVANPTSLHTEVASAAVRAGAAVLVEKPIAHELGGLDELTALVATSGAVLSVGFQLRYHPALIVLRDLLADGVLGRLVAVDAMQGEYLPSFHPYEDYRGSYAARADLGGGVVLTQIHEIDYLHWLFGVPDAVYAVGGHTSDLEIDVEDNVSALYSYELAGRPVGIALHLDYLQRQPVRECTVVGEDGQIVVDLREPRLTWTDTDGSIVRAEAYPRFERDQLFVDEMAHFLAAARGEEDVAVDAAHATDTLRIALATRRSIERRTLERLG
jgi:predicted dehydrogenase